MELESRRLLSAAGVPDKQIDALAILVQEAERTAAYQVVRAIQRRVQETNWAKSPTDVIIADLDKLIKEMFR